MLVLDIETVPTAAALALPYPEERRSPPGNYSKPESIAAWREKDRAAWEVDRIKQYSISPRHCRIVCVGVLDPTEVVPLRPEVLTAWGSDEEAAMLEHLWELIADHAGSVMTWNGGWDLRVIQLRSAALGVTIPDGLTLPIRDWAKRYDTTAHLDVKRMVTGGDERDGSLDDWAEFFGIPGKRDGWTGASVWPAYQAGQYDEIAEYCRQDVLTTHAIYCRAAAAFGM